MQKDWLIKQLVSFVPTDTLLYLPRDEVVEKTICAVNYLLGTVYVLSDGIDVSKHNLQQGQKIEQYLLGLSADEVVFVYQTGQELHSVLLAIMVLERQLDMQKAFELAFYEELKQQEKWGKVEEIITRQKSVLLRLEQLDRLYDKRSVS